MAKRSVYGSHHTPKQLCPWAHGPVPLSFSLLLILFSVSRVSYDLYTHYVFPNPVLGSGGKGVFSKVLLWFNNILTDEQACLSAVFKTLANSVVSTLSIPSAYQCGVHAQLPSLWGQKGAKSV